jgi:uncharacterized membrane protein YphA (DoxX/SURF4 family)
LLLLRLGMGLSMAVLFGGPKLHDAWGYLHSGEWPFVDFNRKVGLPLPVLVAFLQTLNESLGALLLAGGFLARYAAAALSVGFVAATCCSLKAGEQTWLTPAFFALVFTSLLLTGPGRLSIDALLRSRKAGAVGLDAPLR